MKSKYWQITHKFDIRIPKFFAEALKIDKENVNTAWYEAIHKEMKNIRKEFQKWAGTVQESLSTGRVTKDWVPYDI